MAWTLGSLLALAPMATSRSDSSNNIDDPYAPEWGKVVPLKVIPFNAVPEQSDAANGAALAAAIHGLKPGESLEIGDGTYKIESWFNISLAGSAAAPIWIVAAAGATPVVTRSNANQNVINVGTPSKGKSEFLCLRGLEIVGGSVGLRLYRCSQVWIDQCHIHDTPEAALTANANDTDHLFLTNNLIHHTGGTGEGMYLGANYGAVTMRDSVIARNHVHHCGGSQGDGIEVKQGSYRNWIVENFVHDTNYPSLLVYGTGNDEINVVERNVLVGSADNVLQVQGEADVFNNLIVNGAGSGFHSHDHQGATRRLRFEHNTIITPKLGASLFDWGGRPGMTFVNNAIYSESKQGVKFASGAEGVVISGNVVLGSVSGAASTGFLAAGGLADFEDAKWDGSLPIAVPVDGSVLVGAGSNESAAPAAISHDLNRMARVGAIDVGCLQQGSFGRHFGFGQGMGREAPPVAALSELPTLGTTTLKLSVAGGLPSSVALLVAGSCRAEIDVGVAVLWTIPTFVKVLSADSAGGIETTVAIPPDPALVGRSGFLQWIFVDALSHEITFTDGLHLLVSPQDG